MIHFYEENQIQDSLKKYAVVVAMYKEEWIFCKHKERDTYEVPGGHREENESIEDCARRELFEETGATEFTLTPVYTYSVGEGDDITYGEVFFADVKTLGKLPEGFEMQEVIVQASIPKNQTYPQMHPQIFARVQWWRNSLGVEEELWDVYDENRCLTGRTHKRGQLLNEGDFHLVVHIVVKNSKGEYIVTRRAPNKAFPNIWEFTGGSALSGDDSITAAMREVFEETGFRLLPENGKLMMSRRYPDCFSDMWLFEQDFNIDEVVLQEKETTAAMYVDKATLLELIREEKFSDYDFLPEFIEMI